MPTYTFEHNETGEQITLEMKIAELDEYKEANPDWFQVMVPNGTVDPILLGVTKPNKDFREVLSNIKERNPQNNMGSHRFPID